MSGFTYPLKPSDIPRFVAKNHISVYLFGYEEKKCFLIHITDKRWDKHINLLLISKGSKSHYCQLHGPQRTEMPKEGDKWLTYKEVGIMWAMLTLRSLGNP